MNMHLSPVLLIRPEAFRHLAQSWISNLCLRSKPYDAARALKISRLFENGGRVCESFLFKRVGSGGILRSNRYPNDSYLMNWTRTDDAILWDVEVLTAGDYLATLYYTAASGDEGAQITLNFGDSAVGARISEAHDPPEYGMGEDRVLRIESYVKDFRPLPLGQILLEAGRKPLSLRATSIPGAAVADIRLLRLERIIEQGS